MDCCSVDRYWLLIIQAKTHKCCMIVWAPSASTSVPQLCNFIYGSALNNLVKFNRNRYILFGENCEFMFGGLYERLLLLEFECSCLP
jgi:hypothetical protein